MTIVRSPGTRGEINASVSKAAQARTPGLSEKLHDGLKECFPDATVRVVVGLRAVGKVEGYDRSDVEAILGLFEAEPVATDKPPAQAQPQTISYDEAGAATDITPGPLPESPNEQPPTDDGHWLEVAITAFGCDPEQVLAVADDIAGLSAAELTAMASEAPDWVLRFAVMLSFDWEAGQ